MSLFYPLGNDGNCAICKRRHHPGRGCPKWKKWSPDRRRKWMEEKKDTE